MVSFNIAEGNPGALTFLMDAYMQHDPFRAESAFQKMQDLGITGCKLYMLWNDCCNRDTCMAIDKMLECSAEEIVSHINYDNGYGIPFKIKQEKNNECHNIQNPNAESG